MTGYRDPDDNLLAIAPSENYTFLTRQILHHEARAGILVGTAAGPNSIGSNTFFNAQNSVLRADTCTPPVIATRPASASSVNTSSVAKPPRPSPARP